ncbi:hypothetical protein HSBAA_55530 [Vreelandella sulfidaeris]|uniref:Uncharacterized protein n=1 Tax=Vreelandella sulfidaeris TaxID=115553 RepID=A0A455UF02_9GAMM|nr:hypothetical protein HSBAA_55530 [Halomonas sulfidaeris]
MVVAFVHPDNDGLYLERHDAARAQHRRWWRDMQRLSQSISRLTRRLSLPMSPGGRASIHRDITQLEQEQRSLALNEPKRFTLGAALKPMPPYWPILGLVNYANSIGNGSRTAANVVAARQRMERWINARGIGGLPLLIAAVNLVNVTNTMLSAQKDGVDREEMTTLAS